MNFSNFPDGLLQDEFLILRLMNLGDLYLFQSLYCSESIMKYVSNPLEVGSLNDSFSKAMIYNSENIMRRCFLVVVSKELKCEIGISGYTIFEFEKEVEVGVLLLEKFQNRKFAFQILSKLICSIIEIYPDFSVVANLDVRNIAALKLVSRLGFYCLDSGKVMLDKSRFLSVVTNSSC